MTASSTETPLSVYARVAGLLYLLIIVLGISGEIFIRSDLIVFGDAAMTAANIMASEGLFRFGFAADALMLVCDVAIAVLFYVLLRPVSKTLAMAAAAFRLIQAAILGFNLLNYYAALMLLEGSVYGAAFKPDALNALSLLFLEMHTHGYDLGLIFFGISCLILGFLVVRSGYFPAMLGYALGVAGVVYLVGSFTRFLAPAFMPFVEPLYMIPLLAELAFCLWLLLKGVRNLPAANGQ